MNKKIDIDKNFEVDYVIAHSLGALAALYNWNIYKNFKIILINPVISKRNIIGRWYNFATQEGLPDSFKKSIKLSAIIPSLFKIRKLFRIPAVDILNTIPKENLFIVYGENDVNLFDKGLINNLQEKGVLLKRVNGTGHNYDLAIEKVVFEIIKTIKAFKEFNLAEVIWQIFDIYKVYR